MDKLFEDHPVINPRDDQVQAVYQGIKNEKCILTSPTGSGKSLILYSLTQYILSVEEKSKILIIVPTVALVNQLYSDYEDYGMKNQSSLVDKFKVWSQMDCFKFSRW